eukprot:Seg547.1 transcript_id=Seg547.1/GoldUCD/mRNA.D3Y31 product="hypothetical protein" protein_id=Seg547.1/GoldUCD/D3Y31
MPSCERLIGYTFFIILLISNTALSKLHQKRRSKSSHLPRTKKHLARPLWKHRDTHFENAAKRQAVVVTTKVPTLKAPTTKAPVTGALPLLPIMTPPLPHPGNLVATTPRPVTGVVPTVVAPAVIGPTVVGPTVVGSTGGPSGTPQKLLPPYTLPPRKNPHVEVPAPIDVIPVQTVPAQKFIATAVPTAIRMNRTIDMANQTHGLLPNLAVFNVSGPQQGVIPVEPVKDAPAQKILQAQVNPLEPLPIMTRPTVTVLQHLVGPNPTRMTLQSVVVPKRKLVTPQPPLKPLDVIPPHTVPTPMKLLKPLKPIPPYEPLIVHHIPIIPDCKCDPCSNSCDCNTNCSGR